MSTLCIHAVILWWVSYRIVCRYIVVYRIVMGGREKLLSDLGF